MSVSPGSHPTATPAPSNPGGGDGYKAKDYYQGTAAQKYDEARTLTAADKEKWLAEDAVARTLLAELEPGRTVLDMPCGTGRFNPILADQGLDLLALDISLDMIDVGRRTEGGVVGHVQADGTRLPLPDAAVPYALCARFVNIVPLPVVEGTLRDLRRVTTDTLLLEVRLASSAPRDRFMRTVNRLRAAVRSKVRPPKATASMPKREPITIHPEAEFAALLRSTGWTEVKRVEVVYGRAPVRPTPLYFLVLRPA